LAATSSAYRPFVLIAAKVGSPPFLSSNMIDTTGPKQPLMCRVATVFFEPFQHAPLIPEHACQPVGLRLISQGQERHDGVPGWALDGRGRVLVDASRIRATLARHVIARPLGIFSRNSQIEAFPHFTGRMMTEK
jgi:hypothetical protein